MRDQRAVALSLAAVVVALLCGLVLVAAIGVPIADAVSAFAEGAWGSPYALAASINRSLVFALVGLGFVLANRANLTNVGGEGQIAVGAIAATAVCLHGGVVDLPAGLGFVLPMLAACVVGGLWGAIVGMLKIQVGTNEVISSLMLSFIGVWMLYGSVQSVSLLRQPMTTSSTLPESLDIPDTTKLPLLTGDAAMPMHVGLPLALVLALLAAVLLHRTVFGLRLRAVGLNPLAARKAGIAIAPSIVGVFFAAGALGGLAGSMMLQGEQYSLKAGFSSGYGFDGLVVGLLARGSVTGVIAGAMLFGFIRSGGINMEMVANVPNSLVLVIQGVIVVALAGSARWIDGSKGGTR
ncbi:ABC transporter permease [Variovorax ginsengisoli]|uniref:ABC transporter permease n=1 Tax=Variovorax ginsengisoli TaxID=363844 RepID=A0ABT8SEE6_9BURK|nr:ABC transporter permease [Variovorax ginsengisoli]MDN8618127.1 ABC transporter permease [Variovorax ginsengisoli]MDO1537297.1 ABC transporter permease [Variovorax ginsengisoli]